MLLPCSTPAVALDCRYCLQTVHLGSFAQNQSIFQTMEDGNPTYLNPTTCRCHLDTWFSGFIYVHGAEVLRYWIVNIDYCIWCYSDELLNLGELRGCSEYIRDLRRMPEKDRRGVQVWDWLCSQVCVPEGLKLTMENLESERGELEKMKVSLE